jgi:protein SCO1/2
MRWLLIFGAILIAALYLLRALDQRRVFNATAPQGLPVLGTLAEFAVTNQNGVRVTAPDLQGRPWAVDLIFTRCPGPCATLTGVMRSVQDRLPAASRSRLMSITSDPAHDTPEVLAAYARRFGADLDRWQFVTGSREEIRRLATEQLYLVLQDKAEDARESETDLFLHSTLIVLVDREGRLRATIEGLAPGAAERVLAGLAQLESESARESRERE